MDLSDTFVECSKICKVNHVRLALLSLSVVKLLQNGLLYQKLVMPNLLLLNKSINYLFVMPSTTSHKFQCINFV